MYTLFDHLFEPVAVLSLEGKLLYANHYFLTFAQVTPRTLKKGPTLDEIFVTEEKSFFPKLLKKAGVTNEITISEEIPLILKEHGQKYTVVVKVFPLKESKGEFAVFINDLSDEKNLHDKYKQKLAELKESHAQIVQADKMKTLGELSAGIAHEINGPLSVARGNVEVLQFELENFDPKKKSAYKSLNKNIEKIITAIDRVTKIITNMRRYVHSQEEKREYCELTDIIRSATELVSTYLKQAKVELEFSPPSNKVITLVNKTEIEQVLVNLLNNSIDAIVSSNTNKGKIKIAIKINKVKEMIDLTISDNGPGVAPRNREKIFAPFFTTKDAEKGTGLGLSITKKIVEKHQGTIELDAKYKSGAKFNLCLPVVEISSLAFQKNFIDRFVDESKKKIMVVDDDVEILNVLANFIEQDGHFMIGSSDPREALELLSKIEVDMIITDYQMPGMNGSEFAKRVRTKDKKIPIIYLSGMKFFTNFKTDEHSLSIAGFLAKPFSKADVSKAMKKIFGD